MKRLAALLGGCVAVLSAWGAPEAPASATTAVSVRAHDDLTPVAPRRQVHDRTDIKASAQVTDGTVWAVGKSDAAGVFVWRTDAWEKVEDARTWAGEPIEMVASPVEPGVVYSLWTGGAPNTLGDLSVFHVWRHESERPSRLVTSLPNPVAKEDLSRKRPLLSAASDGSLWLSCAQKVLVRVRPGSDGVAPEIIRVGSRALPRSGVPLCMREDSLGRLWWWSQVDPALLYLESESRRPIYFGIGQEKEVAPVVTSLPEQGRVTFVSPSQQGGLMVWAVENAGLWNIDENTLAATPRSSPPGAWWICDWKDLGNGREVALVVDRERRTDKLTGRVWVLENQVWRDAGLTGDTQMTNFAGGGWHLRDRAWTIWDEAIIGVNFNTGVVKVDLRPALAEVRMLGWAEHLSVVQAEALYPLPDGRLMIRGVGTTVIEPGALRRGWMDTRKLPVWVVHGNPVRAEDGRLWTINRQGRDSPAVMHWDGQEWHRWPLPGSRKHWPDQALWVDGRGRVAIFSEKLESTAWERDAAAPEGWRACPSGRALIAARAAERVKSSALAAVQDGAFYSPEFSADGRALIRDGNALLYLREGEWRSFDQRELPDLPVRYGFDEANVPWFSFNRKKYTLGDEGVWTQGEPVSFGKMRTSRGAGRPWPEWLTKRLDYNAPASCNIDAEGVWWVLQDGELWKGVEGNVVRIFADDEPTAFRAGCLYMFYEVLVDATGARLFVGHPSILLPPSPGRTVRVILEDAHVLTDRRMTLEPDAERTRFEWRLNNGPWQTGVGDTVLWEELPVGTQVVEVRGYSRRFEAGPVTRVELRLDYDTAARTAELVAALRSPVSVTRADAISRLASRGAEAEAALHEKLEQEADEEMRWWLLAALQALADERQRAMP